MKLRKIKILRNILFILIIFLFSCGIPTIIYLEPSVSIHKPTGASDDSNKYFEVKTSDKENTNSFSTYFKGFEIFYKIYVDEESCKKDIALANAQKAENPSNSAKYLKSDLKFHFLSSESGGIQSRPCINSTAAMDRILRFRLASNGSQASELVIGGVSLGGVLRENNKKFSFIDISITDSDVKQFSTGTSPPPTEFFVACFIATYGIDENYSSIYSEIVYLGYVKIS